MPKALPAFPTSKVREPGVLGSTDTEYAEDPPGCTSRWPASYGVRLQTTSGVVAYYRVRVPNLPLPLR